MNCEQAKTIDLKKFLIENFGFEIEYSRGYEHWGKSVFRDEQSASMKVNEKFNSFIDFGAVNGKYKASGTIIDFIQYYYHISLSEALEKLNKFSFPPQRDSRFVWEEVNRGLKIESSIEIISVYPLTYNLKLCEYVKSRGIDFHLANQYVKAVQYRRTPWTFWAVGNRNEKGWSLRSEKFKGCTNQSYSLFTNNSNKLCVMEGIFDFLSYVTMINGEYVQNFDYLILNSITNLKSSISVIEKYDHVELYLDRDSGGFSSAKYINKCIKERCEDKSFIYDGYKDLNEYLISTTIKKPNFIHAFRNL